MHISNWRDSEASNHLAYIYTLEHLDDVPYAQMGLRLL
jgi:hypothetical protein